MDVGFFVALFEEAQEAEQQQQQQQQQQQHGTNVGSLLLIAYGVCWFVICCLWVIDWFLFVVMGHWFVFACSLWVSWLVFVDCGHC